MTRTERTARFELEPGSKVGIIAGGGKLPLEVAEGLRRQGVEPFVLLMEGEADQGFETFAHEVLALEQIGSLVAILKKRGVTHLVLAGEIKRRPKLSALKVNLGLIRIAGMVISGLARGDDGLLKTLIRMLEGRGIKVVGAHEIVPDLLADKGVLTKAAPTKADWRDIEAARIAAEAIGALDIGQGAVAIGGRTIAIEGVEGTNGLLERVKDLRGHGRLAGKKRGVLVKCAKPGQELRADLPAIGPLTVEAAHAAGLAGIAVETDRSLVMDGARTLERANALGLFIVGFPQRGSGHGG